MFISKKQIIYLIVYFSCLLSISPTFANTFADIDVGFFNDDNLSRSDYGPDKKSGSAIEVFADYGKFYDLENNWSATAIVFAQYTNNNDFSKLSTLTYGVSGSVRKKLGLGAYSSSIQASISYGINNVSDSKRSNDGFELGLNWNKRLNDIWELTAGVSLDDSSADNSVFDVSGTTVFVAADYTISEKLLLSFGISQRSGDIISVTNPSTNPNAANIILAAGGNIVSDTVFGNNLFAYRLDATTLILKASLSYAINDESSVNGGYELQDSSLDYGINYKNNIIRVNYIYSF